MSLLGTAEEAITAGTPLDYVRLAFKALPWVVIAGLAIALLLTRGKLDHVRMQAKLETAGAQLAAHSTIWPTPTGRRPPFNPMPTASTRCSRSWSAQPTR